MKALASPLIVSVTGRLGYSICGERALTERRLAIQIALGFTSCCTVRLDLIGVRLRLLIKPSYVSNR